MKKISLLIILVYVLGLCACSKQDVNQSVNPDGIFVEVLEETVIPTGLTYRVTKADGKKAGYYPMYYLQVMKKGDWYEVPGDMLFNDVGRAPRKEYEADWTYGYGELPRGKYRINVSISYKGNVFWVRDEFMIK